MRTTAAWVVFVLFGALCALRTMQLIWGAGDANVDPSWQLAYAYFLENGDLLGRDYAFNYGPLGYMQSRVIWPELFASRVAWEICWGLAFATTMTLVMRELAGWMVRIGFAVTLLLIPEHFDSRVIMMFLGMTWLLTRRTPAPRYGVALAILVIVAASFLKLSLLLMGCLCVAVLLYHTARTRRLLEAVIQAAIGLAAFFGTWFGLGYGFAELQPFVWSTMQLVSGYAEGMSLPGPTSVLVLGVFVVGAISVVLAALATSRPLRLVQIAFLGLAACGLFLAWKQGFVRQDGHAVATFNFTATLSFILWQALRSSSAPMVEKFRPALNATVGLLFAASLIGAQSVDHVPEIHKWPGQAEEQIRVNTLILQNLNAWGAAQADLSAKVVAEDLRIPKIVAAVGDETVDVVTLSAGIAVLNGLNFHSRPVFQGYQALTPALAEWNAEFFAGTNASKFVIHDCMNIDGHLPTLDDGTALLEILNRYDFVLRDGAYLLLERRQEPRSVETQELFSASFPIGDPIDIASLGNDAKALKLKLEPSLLGKLRKFLWRAPVARMRVEFMDGEAAVFRVNPGMIQTGVLIDPLPRDHDSWEMLFAQGMQAMPARNHVRSVQLVVGDDKLKFYKDTIEVTVQTTHVPE